MYISLWSYIWFLKALSEDACVTSVERLFQIFAPLNEKHFCPAEELFKGSLKSVAVFRRLRAAQWQNLFALKICAATH